MNSSVSASTRLPWTRLFVHKMRAQRPHIRNPRNNPVCSLSSGSDGRVQTDAVLFGSGASRTAQFGSSVSSSSSRWVLLQEVTPAAGYLIQPCLLRWASLQTVCICSCGSRHGVIGEAYRRWRAPFIMHLPTRHAHAGYGFVGNRRGLSLGGYWLCSVGVATTHPMTCLVPLVLFPTAFDGGGVARAVLLIRRELLLYCGGSRLFRHAALCVTVDYSNSRCAATHRDLE